MSASTGGRSVPSSLDTRMSGPMLGRMNGRVPDTNSLMSKCRGRYFPF